jgi:hypothetical protein
MMENVIRPAHPTDVMAAGFAYDVPGPERDKLYNDANFARRRRMLSEVEDDLIFDAARDYIELEFEASVLKIFRFDLLPGLFQIPDYTRASIQADDFERAEVLIVQQAMLRAARQARLREGSPLRVEAVFNEAMIRAMVGGPQIMKAQLLHLMELAELPNVVIQIVPFSVGAYPAMGSTFTLLSFPHDKHPDVVYVENFMHGQYMERRSDRELCTLKFAGLQRVALSPAESLELIAEVAGSL